MKLQSFFILLISGYGLSHSVISNIRLVDHTSYCIDMITRTMSIIEQRGWSSLNVPDYVEQLNETVLNTQVTGTVRYVDSFVSSIQKLDLLPATLQQQWFLNTTTNITALTLHGSLRIHDVAIGYDVIADVNSVSHRYTAVHIQPLLTFAFAVSKDVWSEEDRLNVTVTVTVPTNTRVPVYRPVDNTSDILASTFNTANINTAGIRHWGEIFQEIVYDIVTNQIPFPNICYNCAVS